MLLDSICMLDVACCSPRTTVLQAARLMREKHTGDLVVTEEDGDARKPLGIITDRDVVVEVLAKGLDPATTPVGSVIRTPVVIAQGTEDSSVVLERMKEHGIRRIPVVDAHERLIGIVTVDDLFRQLATDADLLTQIIARERSREQRTRR
ncbi:MAG TPA: CBS domain-containing protein [Steroidobacteraceae bacterium]|nr:CBS domain-containing protein [Steroidobacteraceae bacterium]